MPKRLVWEEVRRSCAAAAGGLWQNRRTVALAVGTHFGPYEVLGSLGAGGMGEVYRARDTRLKREVALKVLPESFASDPERLARFQREAEVLASLNHPNIAAIHGLEEADPSTGQRRGTLRALVLELVEGPTLGDRIARGLIPADEALSIARQIAEALEAAHERGIIHRDLKPANIKVRDDGTAKVLDFGLAKAMEIAGPQGQAYVPLSQAPTITTPAMTHAGVILGTAAYMAPEQAKGRPVDKRADIWAFGCVLYEMLTGRQPFAGETVTETLAEIMKSEPPWEALPANVPASALLVLRRCLVKDPTSRMRDIGDVRLALAGAFAPPARLTEVPPPVSTPHAVWRHAAAIGIGALLVGAIASGFAVHRLTAPSPGPPTRFTISFPGGALTALGAPRLSISPDGRTVVYGGTGGLYRRSMADLREAPIPGTEGGVDPTFSPDGQWMTFGRTPGDVFKIPISGGTAIPITKGQIRGTSWAGEDSLVLGWVGGGLSRVSANGGEPAPLTTLMTGEIAHRWPQVLPDMESIVFTVWNGALESSRIAVASLSGGGHRVLLDGVYARYSPSGHLVFARGGSLWAAPFDAERLELSGAPVPVLPDMPMTSDAAVQIAIARDGTLVYDALDTRLPPRTLAWVDRQGRETPIPAPERTYLYPRLSPDGRRLAVIADDEEQDLWVWDLTRATLMRATFGQARELFPLWTPDGRRIIFGSEAGGARNIFWRAADGTGAVERLTESRYPQNPTAITPDGRFVVLTEGVPDGGSDIMQLALTPEGPTTGPAVPSGERSVALRAVTSLVRSQYIERNAALSPDGRWLAYEANESGRFEVYVRPYPDVNNGRWQVSTDGGTRPVWSKSGGELFFVSPAGAVMGAGVERAASWVAATPTPVIEPGYLTTSTTNFGAMFDVTPDGQRFVMIKEHEATPETAPPVSVVVVQQWAEELKRLAPAGR